MRRIAAAQPARGEIKAADDDGQHVVEVMRNAAGQLSDGFHLLRLAQSFLRWRPALRFLLALDAWCACHWHRRARPSKAPVQPNHL